MPSGVPRPKKIAENTKNKEKVVRLEKKNNDTVLPLGTFDAEELVFALDIGTRSVVGIVGIQENAIFRVIATEVLEHKSRAMMDGQIHDIDRVAGVVKEIKEKLEARLGLQLKRVAIAAAGRVLKTSHVRVDREIEQGSEIDHELVSSLEIEGIQRAQMMLDEDISKEDKTQFYCVGYSVTNFYLNGYAISKLTGHKGKTIGAEILATFLPHIVVDSLYTVMNRVGLEVFSLTLEPIAAINVTIPQDLRLLNLALVDIGAGTSDIALTREGSVVAYAMAPTAGDEITERITQQYLVDFNTAEKIKLSLSSGKENINFIDILKIKHSVKAQEVADVIRPAVEMLADTIAGKILEYNSKAPNAVFLIGGGSQALGLAGMIADRLGLPKDRVVVRSRDVIRDVKFNDKKFSGPESITPYGIAVTAQMQKGNDFLTVKVNGRKVKLFNSKKLSVADALILLGYNPGQLIGRTGKSITVTLNGEKKIVRGEYGKAAEIFVNQKPANLETYIKYADEITVIPAVDGKDAHMTLSGLLDAYGIDGTGEIYVNGETADGEYVLVNSDAVEYSVNLQDKAGAAGEQPLPEVQPEPEVRQDLPLPEQTDAGMEPGAVVLTVNGNRVVIKENKAQHIFVDVFNYISFDLTRPQGNIVLKLNGQPAAFTDIVRSGDIIEIFWQK